MRLPFAYRLKWIRIKSWWHDRSPDQSSSATSKVTYFLLAGFGLFILWSLVGCSQSKAATSGEVQTDVKLAASPSPARVEANSSSSIEDVPPAPTMTSAPAVPWGNFSAPEETSAVEIRPPATPHPNNPGLINIILLGSDQRPDEYGHRSDVVMLISIDPQAETVKLLSIPRDLYVFIPGWRVDRINVADGIGGPPMVAETILYNFGLDVDHWVRVDFSGFTRAIDSLGGIDVKVGGNLSDYCGRFWTYAPGTYHMDGFQALCYVRMRKSTSDFDRLRREQEVVLALFKKAISIDGLTRLPDLVTQYGGMVETDMELGDLMLLFATAVEIAENPARIERHAITPELSSSWRVPSSGASVVLPDWPAIEKMLQEAFGLPKPS